MELYDRLKNTFDLGFENLPQGDHTAWYGILLAFLQEFEDEVEWRLYGNNVVETEQVAVIHEISYAEIAQTCTEGKLLVLILDTAKTSNRYYVLRKSLEEAKRTGLLDRMRRNAARP